MCVYLFTKISLAGRYTVPSLLYHFQTRYFHHLVISILPSKISNSTIFFGFKIKSSKLANSKSFLKCAKIDLDSRFTQIHSLLWRNFHQNTLNLSNSHKKPSEQNNEENRTQNFIQIKTSFEWKISEKQWNNLPYYTVLQTQLNSFMLNRDRGTFDNEIYVCTHNTTHIQYFERKASAR